MELRSFSRQPDGILANPRLGREEVLEGEHPQDARLARQSIWLSPSLIAEYIQLFFNFIIGTIGLSLAIKFILMIRNDVNLKLEHNVRKN